MMRAIGQWYGGKMKKAVVFLLLVVAAAAVGARGEGVTGASPLLDVLFFVPAAPVSAPLFFTDWDVLKGYVGFDAAFQSLGLPLGQDSAMSLSACPSRAIEAEFLGEPQHGHAAHGQYSPND